MDFKIVLIVIFIVALALAGLYSCNSYRVINKEQSNNYYYNFQKTKVHYIPMGNSFELGNYKMDSVDLATVKVLGLYFLKDKNYVYFKQIKIQNADVQTFKLLVPENPFYAQDKNTIYFQSHPFENIDVQSYSFPNGKTGSIIKDNKHVYSTHVLNYNTPDNNSINPIENLNAEDVQFLNDSYCKSSAQVFFEGKPILSADSKTFNVVRDFAKDSLHVYCTGLIIKNIDASTFSFLEGGSYFKDKNHVYFGLNEILNDKEEVLAYSGKIVLNADPKTFVMVSGEKIDYAKDKHGYYWGGKPQAPPVASPERNSANE